MAQARYDYTTTPRGVVTYKDEAWIGHDKWIAWRGWVMNTAGTGATEEDAIEDLCFQEAYR